MSLQEGGEVMPVLELTDEELDFIYTRCQRKAMRLEEAHLEDIPCYTLANRIMWKIHDLRKETKDERSDK
jgi:hypothetical protein